MASKRDLKAAQERIFARPRSESKSDQELVRKTEDDGVYPSPLNIKSIRLDRITPAEDRLPRAEHDDSLAELGESLLRHGQLLPIVVYYDGDQDVFVLVDGERRWRAAEAVGLQTLQAIIIGRLTPLEMCWWRAVSHLHAAGWKTEDWHHVLEAYRTRAGVSGWAETAQELAVDLAHLEAVLGMASTAPEASSVDEAMGQARAALDMLEQALGRLNASQDEERPVQFLDEVSSRLTALRTRLQQMRGRRQVEIKSQPEGVEKPVRHMPTWGQR